MAYIATLNRQGLVLERTTESISSENRSGLWEVQAPDLLANQLLLRVDMSGKSIQSPATKDPKPALPRTDQKFSVSRGYVSREYTGTDPVQRAVNLFLLVAFSTLACVYFI